MKKILILFLALSLALCGSIAFADAGDVHVIAATTTMPFNLPSGEIAVSYWLAEGTITVNAGGILTWDTSVEEKDDPIAPGTKLVGGADAFINLTSGTLKITAAGEIIKSFVLEGTAEVNATVIPAAGTVARPFIVDADTVFTVQTGSLTVNKDTAEIAPEPAMNLYGSGSVLNIESGASLIIENGAWIVLGKYAVIDAKTGSTVTDKNDGTLPKRPGAGIVDSKWIEIEPIDGKYIGEADPPHTGNGNNRSSSGCDANGFAPLAVLSLLGLVAGRRRKTK